MRDEGAARPKRSSCNGDSVRCALAGVNVLAEFAWLGWAMVEGLLVAQRGMVPDQLPQLARLVLARQSLGGEPWRVRLETGGVRHWIAALEFVGR
jgi:hypothetical protein